MGIAYRGARPSLVTGLLMVLSLTAACENSNSGTIDTREQIDLSAAVPAEFVAHGSVEQLYVTDAVADTVLELVDADGYLVTNGTADDQGTLILRNLTAADGYVVIARSGTVIEASNAVEVTAPDNPPDPSFYSSQTVALGEYGYVQTRDGTLLAINALPPFDPGDGPPYPTVIEYSGYDPANPNAPQPSSLISQALNYAVVGVNMRGTGCSGGAFDFFETLQATDGYDVVEIIAAQDWVKGHKVGMVGISYPGISQLFVAQLQPPSLAAIAPLSVIADIGTGILYPGGILNNGFATDWAAERQREAEPFGQGWAARRRDEGDQTCIANQELRGQNPSLMERIRANPYYYPEIADPLSPTTFVHRINVPVFLAGAWHDEQTGAYFATMLNNFTGTESAHFTVTNGNHTEAFTPAVFARWMEFLDLYVAERIPARPLIASTIVEVIGSMAFGTTDLPLEPERFTDVTTYEEAVARWEAEAPVRVLFENGAARAPGVPGATFERSFSAWPIPELEPTAWYLGNDGQLTASEPTATGADRFAYDNARSQQTSFHGGTSAVWVVLPEWDWRPLEAGKAVAYVSGPLPEAVVMAGSGSADLWITATAGDVDLQVTLSEVRPDGQESLVQSGWLRASHRALDEAASTELRPVHTHFEADAAPLPAGEIVPVRIEIYPFGHVFHAGSRLRVAISAPGGDRPHWQFEALATAADVTIVRSPTHPSRVVLPVIPAVAVDTSLPACPALRGQPCREYVAYTNMPG